MEVLYIEERNCCSDEECNCGGYSNFVCVKDWGNDRVYDIDNNVWWFEGDDFLELGITKEEVYNYALKQKGEIDFIIAEDWPSEDKIQFYKEEIKNKYKPLKGEVK